MTAGIKKIGINMIRSHVQFVSV